MKKPSFLDIEDEFDGSAENDDGLDGDDDDRDRIGRALEDDAEAPPLSPSMDSSFLDMDRKDSFDTVRSSDSAYYVY